MTICALTVQTSAPFVIETVNGYVPGTKEDPEMVNIPAAKLEDIPVGSVPTVMAPLSPPPVTVKVMGVIGNPRQAVSETEEAVTVQLQAIISTVVEVA